MKSQILTSFIFASILANSVSACAHFFPNSSCIPPSLLPTTPHGKWDTFKNLTGCHRGQNVDGLSNLKNYLNYFGYIGKNNFTNEFDDNLRSAIKTYQLNFNLNTTGELDEPTLEQIVRPRCGVADIVNGTTSMNSGKTTRTSSSSGGVHLHALNHYSFFPGTPRWPEGKTELTYAFLPANGLSDAVKAVFARAFQKWSAVIPLTFTETSSFEFADIRIGFFTGDHGDGEPFDGVLGTLAHAFSPPSGRLHLDGEENWVVFGDGDGGTAVSGVDLESVAVHELGHVLGLGHSSVQEAIMYPTISTGKRKVDLAGDDVEGIQVLYGSNPNYTGSATGTTTTSQERGDNSGGGSSRFVGQLWWLWAVVAVGMGLLTL